MGYSYQQMMQQVNLPQREAVGSNVNGFTGQFKPYGGYGSGTNQPVSPKDFAPKKQNDEYARLQMENSRAKAIEDYQKQMQQNNAKEPIFYILVTAGVLVAGYFAYKKFKK